MLKRMTIAEFKKEASEKFNGKFNYEHVGFIHSREPVKITCPEHGSFFQIPYLHLKSKNGCPYCSGVGKNSRRLYSSSHKSAWDVIYL